LDRGIKKSTFRVKDGDGKIKKNPVLYDKLKSIQFQKTAVLIFTAAKT